MTTNSITGVGTLPVLFADDYGFHTGNTWYRGRFRATGKETGIHLVSRLGRRRAGVLGLAQRHLPRQLDHRQRRLHLPGRRAEAGGDNVVSVLTVNMGHEEDYNSTNGNKAARGLTGASLIGAPLTSITWRLQGVRGGENAIDPVRGPLSTGGLYGERAGWSLPGYPDGSWPTGHAADDRHPAGRLLVPHRRRRCDLPKGQDTSLGPHDQRRPVPPVPGDAVRQRLGDRQLRQLPRPAAQLPGARTGS